MKYTLTALLFLILFSSSFSQISRSSSRPVHTYSIVARDTVTGEIGVAVQSHWFSVGSLVTWAEAGVGAVATQSFVDPAYGPLGLEMMRAGKTANEALAGILASDPGKDVRQVAMIDARGNVAAHTGAKCIQGAGHIVGKNYSVQANLMFNDRVWGAMSKAFEAARGDLAERMLAALDAAESVGGDIRGKQSAAILIVRATSTGRPWADRVMELRVEDHTEPLKELRRLVTVHRAYQHMNNGDLALEKNDLTRATEEYGKAEKLFPENIEMKYWHAVGLLNANQFEKCIPMFQEIFSMDEKWRELLPRLVPAGLITGGEDAVKKVLGEK